MDEQYRPRDCASAYWHDMRSLLAPIVFHFVMRVVCRMVHSGRVSTLQIRWQTAGGRSSGQGQAQKAPTTTVTHVRARRHFGSH